MGNNEALGIFKTENRNILESQSFLVSTIIHYLAGLSLGIERGKNNNIPLPNPCKYVP